MTDVLTCIEQHAKKYPSKKRKRKRGESPDPDSPEPPNCDDEKQASKNDIEGNLKIKCPFCEQCSYSIEDYLQHQKCHPRTEAKEVYKLYCSSCSYSTTVIDHLRKHLMRHYNVKPFKCPLCSWRCVTKYQLQQHHINHHLNLKGNRD